MSRRGAIPADLRLLCERQPGPIYLADSAHQIARMAELGIDPDSEFHILFATLAASNLFSSHCGETLHPVADADGELNAAIPFAWEVWELPRRYVAITSLEGEGGYFLDLDTAAIVDFELANRAAFLAGDVPVIAEGAFDFLRWYLADAAEPRGYAAR